MIAVILAAGYATRMYPLTRDFPKPLLEVGGRTILDHLVAALDAVPAVNRSVLVSNRRFLAFYERWLAARFPQAKPVRLLDDGSTSNENRLGALGDLRFALEKACVDDDVLVSAADNLLRFPLEEFIGEFERNRAIWICAHQVTDPARLRRTGVAVLDDQGRVIEFAEKPSAPKSQWAVPPLYAYPHEALPLLKERLEQPGLPESPGSLIQWLYPRVEVRAHRVRGEVLDIGDLASLEQARQRFG